MASEFSPTHTVENQVAPLTDYGLFESDPALLAAVVAHGADWALAELREFGQRVGSRDLIESAARANEMTPVLRTHDRHGHRIDHVDFDPSWHELLELSVSHGLHCLPWRESRRGASVARAALYMLAAQNDFGHCCPLAMTHAAVATLRDEPDVAAVWEPRVTSLTYDRRALPIRMKDGALLGMAMTEKQGGSDLQTNTTLATRLGDSTTDYLLTGHKWFCSAPMCDAFLTLARTPAGLTCFLVPRWLDDETPNNFFIQRLKSKLGNRSNASCEVEFNGTWARRIGEEGRGLPSIMKMVNLTRLDSSLGAAALMRQALVQALHHAKHRSAFGRKLVEQPLMQNVLADLVVESEVATLLCLRIAHYHGEALRQQPAGLVWRLATAIAKFWLCKRSMSFVGEALECLGGNGYVEEFPMARLYRETPVNSIWEGSGNIIALDVLRVLDKAPETLTELLHEIRKTHSSDSRLDVFVDHAAEAARKEHASGVDQARRVVENLALALCGALVVQHGRAEVADAFCASRLAGNWGRAFGTLPTGLDQRRIIEDAFR